MYLFIVNLNIVYFLFILYLRPHSVASQSKEHMVLDRSKTGIVGSNPAVGIGYMSGLFLCCDILCR